MNRVFRCRIIVLIILGGATLGLGTSAQIRARNANRAWKADHAVVIYPTLAIGSPAPGFHLRGVDGKWHTMSDYKDSTLLAIVFTCNHCPTAQLYEARIKKLAEDYRSRGVAFVAIQPNAPGAVAFRELSYTDVEDTLEGMIIRADYRKFTFPYLYDGESQAVSRAYGPEATPDIFVFDRERKLRYEGRIDDDQSEVLVKVHDARAALDAMVAGRAVDVPHTQVFGCVINWREHTEMKQRELRKLETDPVKLEMATAEDLKKLRANPTGHLLMISFWATWCAPCMEEFHDLETTWRWYRIRDFELVTVSVNTPDASAEVMNTLRQEHATTRNLQFASEDTYTMQAAFDPKWESGVPFTMVLAPGGKVIYQEAGEVHLLALRRVILANLPDDGYIGNSAYWASK